MLPTSALPAAEVKERRSRRSHKNSKDGCPNCRANRVKCSEHLPSCLQCMKKHYRCGYLDFPQERLEHIRKKNEMLQMQAAEAKSSMGQEAFHQVNMGSVSSAVQSTNMTVPLLLPQPFLSRSAKGADLRLRNPGLPNGLSVPQPVPHHHPVLMQHQPQIDLLALAHPGLLQQASSTIPQMIPARSSYLSRYSLPVPLFPSHHTSREVPQHIQQAHAYNSPYVVDMPYQQSAYSHPSLQYAVPISTHMYASPPPMVILPPLLPYEDFSRPRVSVPSAIPSVIPRSHQVTQARAEVKPQAKLDPGTLLDEGTSTRNLPSSLAHIPDMRKGPELSAHMSTQIKPEDLLLSVPLSAAPETPQILFKVEDYSNSCTENGNQNDKGPGGKTVVDNGEGHAHSYKGERHSKVHNGIENDLDPSRDIGAHDMVIDSGGHRSDHSHHRRKRIRIREHDSNDRQKASVFLTNFRSVVYSNVLLEVTHDLRPVEKDVPPDYRPWEEDVPCGFTILDPSNPFFSNEFESVPDTTPDTARSSLLTQGASFNGLRSRSISTPHSLALTPASPQKEHCLPNCEVRLSKFKVLEIPQHLQSNLFEETVRDLKNNGAHIQFHTNVKSRFMRPVYSDREFSMLWVEVFLRATVYDLFFIYFIDKSTNILVRASEKIVDGDIVYSPPLDTSSVSSGSNYSSSGRRPHHFFYNGDDLKILTDKSYAMYGRVISELRNSINLYSPEFPARMSLFSAWACYTNPQPGFNTFMLMIRGTLVLFRNSLNLSIAENTTFKMHQEFLILELFSRQSLYPDYNFNIVLSLVQDFETYKSFVEKLIELQENGCNVNTDILSVISDPIFRHDFHELNKIIKKLLHSFHPQVSAHNRHFKNLHDLGDDGNYHFVSPTLLFEFLYDWFYMCPDEKMYMGSKINPVKKVVYMFYHALAKCLAHCFTPMKSVLLVDACNVTCTKVGLRLSKPELLDDETYRAVRPILRNLTRTIRFFETRLKLLAYSIIKESVLDDEFIRPTKVEMSSGLTYKDIVQILPAKIKVRERQIENISQTIFAAHNFPFPEEVYADPLTADMIHLETERQHLALQKEPYVFDYSVGLANHDFHPDKIVEAFVSQKKDELDQSNAIANEKLCVRLENMLKSRDVISSSVRRQSGSPA